MQSVAQNYSNVHYSSQLDDTNFYRYILNRSARSNRYIILLFAIFNLFLIIPDWINVTSLSTRVMITFLRVILSLSILLFLVSLPKMRNFRRYSILLSGLEIASVALFLLILVFYDSPNYLIQSLGLITILIGIFLIPNKWLNMIGVAMISFLAFLFTTSIVFSHISFNDRMAGIVYISIIGTLSAIGARGTEKFRLREYQHIEDLRIISTTDPLTKASNRLRLETEGHRLVKKCKQKRQPLSLLFIDIDNMKMINDKYGHLIGDQVLIEVVSRAQQRLKKDDLIARWGGDEFIIVLPRVNLKGAIKLAEEIRNSIIQDYFSGGIQTSCSFGVASMHSSSTFSSLIYEADQQMYEGKKKGKNRVEYASPQTHQIEKHSSHL